MFTKKTLTSVSKYVIWIQGSPASLSRHVLFFLNVTVRVIPAQIQLPMIILLTPLCIAADIDTKNLQIHSAVFPPEK